MEATKVYSMPRIGDAAPEFQAVTTQGRSISRLTIRASGKSFSAIRPTSLQYVRPSS